MLNITSNNLNIVFLFECDIIMKHDICIQFFINTHNFLVPRSESDWLQNNRASCPDGVLVFVQVAV